MTGASLEMTKEEFIEDFVKYAIVKLTKELPKKDTEHNYLLSTYLIFGHELRHILNGMDK